MKARESQKRKTKIPARKNYGALVFSCYRTPLFKSGKIFLNPDSGLLSNLKNSD